MFAKTTDLINLKTDVRKSDLDSLQTVLGYIVVHDVFKKIFFDKLDLKVKEIDFFSKNFEEKKISSKWFRLKRLQKLMIQFETFLTLWNFLAVRNLVTKSELTTVKISKKELKINFAR